MGESQLILRSRNYDVFDRVWVCVLFLPQILSNQLCIAKNTIGIIRVFSCINICRVPRKLFEHEAARPNVQTSTEGPGKSALKQTCLIVILAFYMIP